VTYQDKWLNGRLLAKGSRECANRYQLVKEFCKRFDGAFSVCDIGANMCYFGLRLTEDFPLCTVTAFEFNNFNVRLAHVQANNTGGRLQLVKQKLAAPDVVALAKQQRFEVVLAMSVLHHAPGPFATWLAALSLLGRHVIMELALRDSGQYANAEARGYHVPEGAVILGYGESHLDINVKRPIVVISE
jgi:hypothetical protein